MLKIIKKIKETNAIYVDFRFTDPRGRWQRMTHHVDSINEDFLQEGILFDGSSIAGFRAINESDMLLVPDPDTCVVDPFSRDKSLIVFCDVADPKTGQGYNRDPRSTARRAELFLQQAGVGDKAYVGPEAEFFVFDSVRVGVSPMSSMFELSSFEDPSASAALADGRNHGYRPALKGGYSPVSPVDHGGDLRAEMVNLLKEMGLKVEKHHHEVAACQYELGFVFDTLLKTADNMQIYKYVVQNVAHRAGKSATFMPKPVKGDNGTGMHVHQSIWKDGKPLFAGEGYAGLSKMALHYIGGVVKHARALNAITNPTTNSYKRLVPGYEAPVLLAYSASNRSASCRIPFSASSKGKRVEVRFPDPAANPYLCYAALLMAGLDGIANKIDPGEAMDKNLYDLPPRELKEIPSVCGSLREALGELERDHAFLLKGGVFSEDQISSYIDLRYEEVHALEQTPSPIEFQLYYSV